MRNFLKILIGIIALLVLAYLATLGTLFVIDVVVMPVVNYVPGGITPPKGMEKAASMAPRHIIDRAPCSEENNSLVIQSSATTAFDPCVVLTFTSP